MRQQTFLLVTAIVIASEIITASVTTVAQQKAFPVTFKSNNAVGNGVRFTPVVRKGVEPLEQAYQDVIKILSINNSCSRFFGPTNSAEKVLARLVAQFQLHPLRDSRTGIQMSGSFTYFEQAERNRGFRLFATATINTRGPFFKAKAFPTEPHVPPVGSFFPNTREARVLMLLHELAHLVKGPDGSWLIPDDGNAPGLSTRNTALIEAQCKPEVLSVSQRETEQFIWNQVLWRSNWS